MCSIHILLMQVQKMANTVAVQWSVLWIVLWYSALFMSAASGADVSPPEVVAYWDAALHGGSMPSTIRAMLSPLSAHQTTQLLLLITATTGYLPTHAASFCKAAHIQCGQSNNISDAPAADPPGTFLYEGYPHEDPAGTFLYEAYLHEGRSAAVAHHSKPAKLMPTPVILPRIKHRKVGPAALDPTELPLAQATKEDVVHGSHASRADVDPELFFFMHNHNGEGENPASDAQLAKIRHDGSDVPRGDIDPKPGFFIYNHNGAGGVKEGQNPGSHAELAKIRRASDADAEPEPNFFLYTYGGSGGTIEAKLQAAKNSLSDTTAAEVVHGSDVPRGDIDPEPGLFIHNGAGGVKEGQNRGSHAELAKIPRASDADAEPEPTGSGGTAVEATGNPASTISVDAVKVHASAVPSSGVKATKSPAADDRSQTEAVRALLSSSIRKIPGIFFREKQVLVSGVRIYVHLATGKFGNEDQRAFLPRKLAQVFPLFSQAAQNLSSILGVSTAALQGTLDACQRDVQNDMNAEVSACLTSLEDISDFVSSVMGSTTQPIHTYDSLLNASNAKFSGKTYYVESVKRLKQDPDEPAVTCHDMAFPFRVFYCHYVKKTMIFQVTLQGDDGTSHNRIAVCHYDTSYWNPKHISFAELHTKPGEAEACHWLGKSWMGQGGWVFARAE